MTPIHIPLVGELKSVIGERLAVEPDAPEARHWLIDEVSKPEYQAAKPTWFDLVSKAIADWFASLQLPSGEGLGGLVPLILIVLSAALLVAAFFIFGVPRLRRRSSLSVKLFGAEERRTADALRVAAERAARHGDFSLAIQEMFRALARSLVERTVLTVSPGTTAHGFARRAGASFPAFAGRLEASARAFDEVRYLGGSGSEHDYTLLAQLERELRTEKPAQHESPSTELAT